MRSNFFDLNIKSLQLNLKYPIIMENHSENTSFENYLARRANICKTIDKQKYQDLEFSEEEQAVNQIFRKKLNEQRALLPNSFYREYTLKYLNLIESSEIFPLIKKMPKGGVLHIHLDCCFNMSWVRKLKKNLIL